MLLGSRTELFSETIALFIKKILIILSHAIKVVGTKESDPYSHSDLDSRVTTVDFLYNNISNCFEVSLLRFFLV